MAMMQMARSLTQASFILYILACKTSVATSMTLLHPGDARLPPLMEVPAAPLPLKAVVKPPDVDSLWEWQARVGLTDADPSWASVWPSAAALAFHITSKEGKETVRGKAVAELGAGLGVAGLTAASVGASSVTLCDRDPLALHCAMSSAVVCGIQTGPIPSDDDDDDTDNDSGKSCIVSATASDWANLKTLNVEVVLASEVLYDKSEVASLAQCVSALLKKRGGTLLLTDPRRERAPGCREAFISEIKAEGANDVSISSIDANSNVVGMVGGDNNGEEIVIVRANFGFRR